MIVEPKQDIENNLIEDKLLKTFKLDDLKLAAKVPCGRVKPGSTESEGLVTSGHTSS